MMNKSTLARSVLCAALLGPILLTGCSSTRTHESAGEYSSDSVVTAKVKSALIADVGLKSLPITVKTYRGLVELSGFVDSASQIERAVSIARGVKGVESVHNDLHIKPR